jgi:hypothetical protein
MNMLKERRMPQSASQHDRGRSCMYFRDLTPRKVAMIMPILLNIIILPSAGGLIALPVAGVQNGNATLRCRSSRQRPKEQSMREFVQTQDQWRCTVDKRAENNESLRTPSCR